MLLVAAYVFASFAHVHTPHFFMPVAADRAPCPREISWAIGLPILRVRRIRIRELGIHRTLIAVKLPLRSATAKRGEEQ